MKQLKGVANNNYGTKDKRPYQIIVLQVLELGKVMGGGGGGGFVREEKVSKPSKPSEKIPKQKPPKISPTFVRLSHNFQRSGSKSEDDDKGFHTPLSSKDPTPPSPPPPTRVESLQAAYLASQTANKSWDDVDQRWVPSKTKAKVSEPVSSAKLQKPKTPGEIKEAQNKAVQVSSSFFLFSFF